MTIKAREIDPLQGLECRLLETKWETALIDLFRLIEAVDDSLVFHPHGFSEADARQLATYRGEDLYYVLVENDEILAYGMLRGWDEGYQVPSLGIYVRPGDRGKGLGKLMMLFLQTAARQKGATKIRLSVYADNQVAIALYRKMGYNFTEKDANRWIGFLDL